MTDIYAELQEISEKLFTLQREKVERLARLLESSREQAAGAKVADAALNLIRPRLQIERPDRVLTPLRVFCWPFEQLLAENRTRQRILGRIGRASIRPVWSLLLAHLPDGTDAAWRQACATARGVHERDRTVAAGSVIWPAAADALGRIRDRCHADRAERAAVVQRLGSEALYEEFEDIVGLMDAWVDAVAIDDLLSPVPVGKLADAQVALVGARLDAAAERGRPAPGHIIMLVLPRLEHSYELLRLLQGRENLPSGIEGTSTLMAFAHRLLAGSLERLAEDIASGTAATDRAVARLGRRFLDEAQRFDTTVGPAAAQGMKAIVNAARGRLRDMVDNAVLQDAIAIVTSGDRSVAAEQRAKALRTCRQISDELGLTEALEAATGEIRGVLLDGVGRRAATAEGSAEERREAVTAEIGRATRLIELMSGPEDAYAVYRDLNHRYGN